MNIFSSINELSLLKEPLVLVGGTFDGVHLGHQALICRAQEEAQKYGGRVVVMTFDQHPAAFLRPEQAPKVLSSTSQKIELIEKLGVRELLLLPFNATLAATTATQFIHQIVKAAPSLKAICVGANWAFGQGGKGNVTLLGQLGEKHHFSVITMDPVLIGNEVVSSTRIRSLIATGDLKNATACLGYRYTLSGSVIHGAGLAKGLGFPTANLMVDQMQLPPNGVYLTKALVHGSLYHAGVNIGFRPTIYWINNKITVEAHLLDFTGDLYGKEMRLEFISFIREEITFMSIEDLRVQINKDLQTAKTLLLAEPL
ncbi:MAG: bifunctional riboflavin kinase/FAD synthetase [Chthoniobacterales bacterium]|nr:bifunctional riboflavin kinase/FAD synthetase [Chthoniobacterales bacterium]